MKLIGNNQEVIRKLTIAVFRVTEGFCGSKILRTKIQEQALDVFSGLNDSDADAPIGEIRLLKDLLMLAKELKLTKPVNCDVLIKEYDVIAKIILLDCDASRKEVVAPKDKIKKKTFVKKSVPAPKTKGKPKIAPVVKKEKNNRSSSRKDKSGLTERQKKIMGMFIGKVNGLKLKDVSNSFENITPRTLRNDMKALIFLKKIRRHGGGAGSSYRLMSF